MNDHASEPSHAAEVFSLCNNAEHLADMKWAFESGWKSALADREIEPTNDEEDVIDFAWGAMLPHLKAMQIRTVPVAPRADVDSALFAAIAARRSDLAFMDRLTRSVESHRHILEGLSDS